MKNFCKHLLWIGFFAIGILVPVSSDAQGNKRKNDEDIDLVLCKEHKKKTKHKRECFKHNIQLQLSDSLGFPVPGTEFWVTLDIIKQGNLVTIQFPVINFQTGPSAKNPVEPPPLLPGGYLYTSDGFLPECTRPNDLVYRSILAASNNGASQPFSFAMPPEPPYANIPAAYILSVTNAGAIVVQCAGTFGNIIPPGPQILMPTDITYIVKPKVQLCNNYIIDPGFTNTTQFTNGGLADAGIRDSHPNDAFDNIVTWSWQSNANVADKTNGITNLFVAVGTINNDGTLSVGAPVQLTDFPAEVGIFDTAVAINRTNKNNIVVSYGVLNANTYINYVCRAVSFDGGKTWPAPFDGTNSVPFNGLINIQPTKNFGDFPGVQSDKFGNIWCCYGQPHSTNNPTFFVSVNKGVDFQFVYIAPPVVSPNDYGYDYPQYCFGEDGQGNYGLWFVWDYIGSPPAYDLVQSVGFIPIKGPGVWGSATVTPLTSLINSNSISNITASLDGRVWLQGSPNIDNAYNTVSSSSYIAPGNIIYKSPGPLDQNYAGPWNYVISSSIFQYDISNEESQPTRGYLTVGSVKSLIYDDQRQALYAMLQAQTPDYSQNMRIYFVISRDNGQTWSSPIDIATTDFANRGFETMALDPVTGNLVFGWYDGRNDPTYKSVQYFGAVIPAEELDKLVNSILLSNPVYSIPSPAVAPLQLSAKVGASEAKKAAIKNRFERRLKGRLLNESLNSPAA